MCAADLRRYIPVPGGAAWFSRVQSSMGATLRDVESCISSPYRDRKTACSPSSLVLSTYSCLSIQLSIRWFNSLKWHYKITSHFFAPGWQQAQGEIMARAGMNGAGEVPLLSSSPQLLAAAPCVLWSIPLRIWFRLNAKCQEPDVPALTRYALFKHCNTYAKPTTLCKSLHATLQTNI